MSKQKTIKVTLEEKGKPAVVISFTEEFFKKYGTGWIGLHELGTSVSRAAQHLIDNHFPEKE